MSQVDRPELAAKPEPFLTLQINEGTGGTYIRCSELDLGIGYAGAEKREITIAAIQEAIPPKARILVRRSEEGTLPDHISPEQLKFAKQIIEAIEQGLTIAELIKPQ